MGTWRETHRFFFIDCNAAWRIADRLNALGRADLSYNVETIP
jgi:hypothetical protein